MSSSDYAAPAFAVIGISGRFPGAANPDALWANLRAGKESITFFSDEELVAAGESPERLRDPAYVRAAGRVDDIDKFDASFFGMSPRDAAIFDPQHRVFLECAWEAFENAGYVAERFEGPVGVFGASGGAEYLMHNLLPNRQVMESVGAWLVRHTGNDPNFLATRVSYELNLSGPSMSVQTACSSSLAAVHLACQSLLNGECEMALAGGSTIYPEQNRGYLYKQGEILSPDGHCRAFDANSAGTVMASAVGCVIIRRLEDAVRDGDRILAIIRGSAVNNDGSQKVGYLAPSVTGQARVISEALAIASIEPEDVSYIEAHGTGTLIGDPIEIAALTQAFRGGTHKNQFCAIGSLKSNIGHAGEASGICGLIKTILALKHREIPASLHFETPNPQADLANSPFFVNTRLREWTVPAGKRRIAGVTSLGAGGTNVHVLLEEPPTPAPVASTRSHELLVLSARTSTALEQATRNLSAHLCAHPEVNLADEAFTLLAGRKHFAHRRALVVKNAADAVAALDAPDQKRLITQARKHEHTPAIFFMFPGGGAQYARMGADLYQQEPTYRAAFDEALSHLDPDLRAGIRALAFVGPADADAASASLEAPSRALPALLATEYALARLLADWGIEPAAMIGHSAGEYAAACLAGVITIRAAMTLVAMRGRLFETMAEGAMLSVSLPVEEVQRLVGPELSIAAVNAPSLCVLSGPVAAIAAAEKVLKASDVECTRVHINVAAHSAMVEPILAEFERFCRTIAFQRPQIPFVSNVSGTWITDDEATDPTYWVRHLRGTVRFAEGIKTLSAFAEGAFCEIGPGRTLTSLVRQQTSVMAGVTPTLRHPRETESDVAFLLGAVGRLWLAGVPLDESRFLADSPRRRAALPTYPFERQRYWVDPDPVADRGRERGGALRKRTDIADWFYASSWARSAPPSSPMSPGPQSWLVFSDESSVAAGIVQRLRTDGHTVVEVVAAERFGTLGPRRYGVNPAARADFGALARELRACAALPQRVLHLWGLSTPAPGGQLFRRREPAALETYDRDLGRHYFSLLFFAQAFAADADALRLICVSSSLQSVGGADHVRAEKAALLGPCKVIPREYPSISSVSIDVALPRTAAHEKQLIDRLMRELVGHSPDQEIALRGTDRWVRRFDPVKLGAAQDRPWLRDGGVYLITGGLGGIGLRLAEHLARSGPVKLALISRTPLPEGEQAAAHGPGDATSRRLASLRAIRELGAEVMTISADVTDLTAMRAAVGAVRARFGAVHGAFHTAGVLQDELIALRSETAQSRVLDTKMKGALVLDAVLTDEPLDLFVLFSSVSSILGLPAQVDYTAANAFLDTFAHARAERGPGRSLSIDWNAWLEVGMLANGAASSSHPALQTVVSDEPRSTLFRSTLRRSSSWLLGEHVVRGGDAVIPGTGLLEIARAALEHRPEARAVELSDVLFLAPFVVRPNGERSLYVRIERGGDHAFSCYAESDKEPLVVGKARYVDAPPGRHADLGAIRERCTRLGDVDNGQLVQHFMDFGPRWGSLQRIDLGDREALVRLELPEAFADDLDVYRLHPALLDLATGGAQAMIPGFDARTTFYVPFSYERVLVRRPLTARVFSHIHLRDSSAKDSVVFDATLYDADGEELAVIDGFTMCKAARGFSAQAPAIAGRNEHTPLPKNRPETATEAAIRQGMTPAEGFEALDRMLALEFSPQVVACTVPLHDWLERLAEESREQVNATGATADAAGPVFARPTVGTTFAAPANAIERELAALWCGLIGLEEVGVHDDFFELGGNSLTAVRLFAKIKKALGVDLALDTLFRAPTIATCAQIIAAELGIDLSAAAGDAPQVAAATPVAKPEPVVKVESVETSWSPLVPIQTKGSGTPFFCMHGAMGNVLNLRDLAVRMGEDRPFYALQAQGVDGKLRPLESIEAMATQYIAAVRQVQPHGPYLLGGFSGGGVIAFEMAQQLHREGEETAIVALLDTFSPLVPTRRYAWRERLDQLVRSGPRYVRDRFQWWRGSRKYARQVQQINACTDAGLVVPLELRETHLYNAYMGAQKRYQPEMYSGRLTLFRAREIQAHNAHAGTFLGWDGLAEDGIEVHEMPGAHDEFVLVPHVESVVAELRKCLARADGARKPVALPATDRHPIKLELSVGAA